MRLAVGLMLLAALAPLAAGFAPMVERYVGPGDLTQTTLKVPSQPAVNVGGATFIHLPAGTTQATVQVVDDRFGPVDFVVCQDVNGNNACQNNTADLWREACGSVTVTGVRDDLSIRVFVLHNVAPGDVSVLGIVNLRNMPSIGKCPGVTGVTTGTITLTPS